MENLGDYPITLRYSRRTYHRVVYMKDDGTYWCKWYGELIELERRSAGFTTVENY